MSTTSVQRLSATSPSSSTVEHVAHPFYDPLAEERLSLRLAEIARLPANWDNDGASAPNAEIIDSVNRFTRRLVSAPAPSAFPTVDGGIQLEWHTANRALELEFDAPNSLTFIKWDRVEKTSEEGELSWPPGVTDGPRLHDEYRGLIAWLQGE